MTTTTEPHVRRGPAEIALWWVMVVVVSFVFSIFGLAIALIGTFTRLQAHHVQRAALPVVAVLVSIVSMIASLAFTTTTHTESDEFVVPDAAATATR
ncbi:hypothetical protein [Aeromicrobium sp. IC_218]|uniref:hypothetical protein n=1 Tax=Aeromicrobium sp. IC_218 TaxID=2545468 RepID=UPI001038FE90|nr:hypothetical protein [Aeromicrobium sp. IC_218]TCJ00770.1 hypothetical protein E0W78_01405 [Aeromicrobium sp. IC_218]